MDGVPASILVDTGLAVTIVHRRLWEHGQVGSGKLQPVEGGHLAGTDFTHNVLVSGNVTQDCLLGADFLAAHGFVIDLQSQVLCQGQTSTPLLHQPESTLPVCRVAVSDTVIVQAGEEKLLFCQC